MQDQAVHATRPSLGIIGFGAFGRLIAQHLGATFDLFAYDPRETGGVPTVTMAALETVASCPFVVLSMPVNRVAGVVAAIAPHLKAGTMVLDVGSVKSIPAAIMDAGLPADVEVVATHPLFGPQSAKDGIAGLKIAVCPIRGRRGWRVGAFFRKALKLDVIMTTPDAHDREAAMVQGLTHLIAKVLVEMEPLPSRMTTRSFDLIMQAVGMVRDDAPEVFEAIERANPHSRDVRDRFFTLAAALERRLDEGRAETTPPP